jgi:hypothetical protein
MVSDSFQLEERIIELKSRGSKLEIARKIHSGNEILDKKIAEVVVNFMITEYIDTVLPVINNR